MWWLWHPMCTTIWVQASPLPNQLLPNAAGKGAEICSCSLAADGFTLCGPALAIAAILVQWARKQKNLSLSLCNFAFQINKCSFYIHMYICKICMHIYIQICICIHIWQRVISEIHLRDSDQVSDSLWFYLMLTVVFILSMN